MFFVSLSNSLVQCICLWALVLCFGLQKIILLFILNASFELGCEYVPKLHSLRGYLRESLILLLIKRLIMKFFLSVSRDSHFTEILVTGESWHLQNYNEVPTCYRHRVNIIPVKALNKYYACYRHQINIIPVIGIE